MFSFFLTEKEGIFTGRYRAYREQISTVLLVLAGLLDSIEMKKKGGGGRKKSSKLRTYVHAGLQSAGKNFWKARTSQPQQRENESWSQISKSDVFFPHCN